MTNVEVTMQAIETSIFVSEAATFTVLASKSKMEVPAVGAAIFARLQLFLLFNDKFFFYLLFKLFHLFFVFLIKCLCCWGIEKLSFLFESTFKATTTSASFSWGTFTIFAQILLVSFSQIIWLEKLIVGNHVLGWVLKALSRDKWWCVGIGREERLCCW